MSAPRITIEMLHGACRAQREIFAREWPSGAEATIENVRRAQELELDLRWGERWFSPEARQAYWGAFATVWRVYDQATATVRDAYRESTATTVRDAYQEAIAPAKRAYDEAIATAWLEAFVESRPAVEAEQLV